ncbi:response regulator [Roseibacterium sp. SDUM158017]|uniref:response regulator n=1 Tax=Roseicyclus salinarum TaxID=3036773 RepID=UPI0024155E70|nr:response regulator [Roseibacterium sp. SDUM158017]MDG4648739.1 response regulator [Roseibacterium sp. SDUM158017]
MTDLRCIVHVEDELDILEFTRMALEIVGGFEVVQFSSPEQALADIEHHSPDLFLLDYMMPGMSGPELWRQLRTRPRFRNTPAIFMTAKVDIETAEALRSMGALQVIKKPFDPMTLSSSIEIAWETMPGRANTK